jgi:transposase
MVWAAMSDTPVILPDDPAALKAMILSLQVDNARMDADITKMSATLRAHEALVQALQIQIARLKKQKFGASSERIEREIEQLELALEYLEIAGAAAISAIAPDDDAELSAEEQAAAPTTPRRRKPLVAEGTPRERIVLDPGDDCPECGGTLRLVGEDVSEILELIAARLKLIETARLKKSCRRCEKITQLPAPSRPALLHGPYWFC